jgi:hypothetical protein
MNEPSRVRGRWMLYVCPDCGRARMDGSWHGCVDGPTIEIGEPVEVIPVPDEQAIERAAAHPDVKGEAEAFAAGVATTGDIVAAVVRALAALEQPKNETPKWIAKRQREVDGEWEELGVVNVNFATGVITLEAN